MTSRNIYIPIVVIAAMLASFTISAQVAPEERGVENVVQAIEKLEGKSDPKCHATATRLENFMYGTPLTADARERKVELQKEFIGSIWHRASEEARKRGLSTIDAGIIEEKTAEELLAWESSTGGVMVQPESGEPIELEERDVRHYSSIAYALRAILAVQQEALFDPDLDLVPLQQDAIDRLKWIVDIGTLATLKTGDTIARRSDSLEIDAPIFAQGWMKIFGESEAEKRLPTAVAAEVESAELLERIIEQKVASYEKYHEGYLSGPLLFNNVRSFYARHEWPEEEPKVESIQNLFVRLMTNMVGSYTDRAQEIAKERGDALVREVDVARVFEETAPFTINEYEDITYFYRLPREERVQIEAYDADSFRDSGLHWILIRNVLESPDWTIETDFDPFAAELLAEGTAQMGVLLYRVAGMIAKEQDQPVLAPAHLIEAAARIDNLMEKHLEAPALEEKPAQIASASGKTRARGKFFADVTGETGIDFVHRSADWVKRFERSFMYVDSEESDEEEKTYLLDVPPVFGGSGVAASDLDADGHADLLILGGLGNRLYRGLGDGTFEDVTSSAGVRFVRPDGNPGEPRQPLLVDLDNDGLRDIVITYVDDLHRVYRNLGDMEFEDVTERTGLGGVGLVGSAATAADFDRDGLVDLYISYYGNYLAGDGPTLARINEGTTPNRLFRNLGDFRFEDVTAGSGTDNTGWTQAAAAIDFDGDGWQDLIVGNDFGVNAWYRNRGGMKFENAVEELEALYPSNSMNVGTADLNRDGFPDVYISNIFYMVKDEKYVLPTENTPMKRNPEKLGTMRIFDANHLFTSVAENGKLQKYVFSLAVDRGETATGWAWDADFFDFDHDGDDDLYCVNGLNEYNIFRPKRYDEEGGSYEYARPGYEASVNVREPNVFFVNEDGKLRNRSEQSGADQEMNARGAVYLDIDDDGDLDIVVNNYQEKAIVLENQLGDDAGNWMKVELIGDVEAGSNRDAIGATAIAMTPSGNRIWRAVQGGTGYLSDHPKVLHFGLGDAEHADLLVRWPNGETSRYENLKAGETHTIEQRGGERAVREVASTSTTP